ncbi:hypothetical protein A2Z33_05440 [Candidatus Gottesmanbacteria bacterium RBG_16_52_11]|uniref:Uncharacterized protein n=1 Tax=Candidatus Gottesmanbacteria bacterium RBG_16_52_11 TaxID=1798374 RepID=A0A1F5YWE6_9BACT|nr:MAG: hypothetical protein A2Z33_05440 [Candidatus Gottesmanbacteria bacterium RBG_16_52_11]
MADGNPWYEGALLGVMLINDREYKVFKGGDYNGDSVLDLPGDDTDDHRGGAWYDGTVYLHRMWKAGWLELRDGMQLKLTLRNGAVYTYSLVNQQQLGYGVYPVSATGIANIASCYSLNDGTWGGIELYSLQVVSYTPPMWPEGRH